MVSHLVSHLAAQVHNRPPFMVIERLPKLRVCFPEAKRLAIGMEGERGLHSASLPTMYRVSSCT